MNQKGFATLEVILMVMVIGILATVAVPRFERITAQANTAKVVSDLTAINSAIAVYKLEKGTADLEYTKAVLGEYFNDGELPQEPNGGVYVGGTITDMSGQKYGLNSTKTQATFGGKTASEFTIKPSSSSSSGSGNGTGGTSGSGNGTGGTSGGEDG